jgi:hypothetical protein
MKLINEQQHIAVELAAVTRRRRRRRRSLKSLSCAS